MISNRCLALDPNPYTPLDCHLDIRTLVLEPARSWSDPIKCQLWVSLAKSENRYYEAVSYCWDDYEKSNLIHVNDRPYYITDSLNSFLRYRRDKDQSVTLCQIDAICINQDDHEEKQKQVQLMREIYLCSDVLLSGWDRQLEILSSHLQRYIHPSISRRRL